MDREVIGQKLESLRRCLQRIVDKCPPDPETLSRDPDLQDIVAINLTRAVQLCVDIGAHLIAGMQVPPPDTDLRRGRRWVSFLHPSYSRAEYWCCVFTDARNIRAA